MGKSGKLGQAKFGQWKLGDVFLEGAPVPPHGGGRHGPANLAFFLEELEEDDIALAFVLTQV